MAHIPVQEEIGGAGSQEVPEVERQVGLERRLDIEREVTPTEVAPEQGPSH